MSAGQTQAIIALGSNLSDPVLQVKQAIQALARSADITLLKASSLYSSSPQGPQDQGDFVNAAVLVSTNLSPEHLLKITQTIEADFGRVKTRHWGERIIDIDIAFFGQNLVQLESPDLVIPHREALTRDFVLVPALEVAPDWILPDGSPLQSFYKNCLDHHLKIIEQRPA